MEADTPQPDKGPSPGAAKPSTTRVTTTGRKARAGPMAALALGALGVVYGDIGTSPLYAIREAVSGPHGIDVTRANVLGILSLVFWSLTLVVVVKYLMFVLTADHDGEGGAFALMARLMPRRRSSLPSKTVPFLVLVGLCGASLLYGEGIITPAISVLSAVEGLGELSPALHRVTVPLTVAILAALFLIQKRGTGRIGAVLGPVMLVWFVTIAVLGISWIARNPSVLVALHPRYAVAFFLDHGLYGFYALGAVVLCITGGEALYADLGHFGRAPIRIAWFVLVFPSLVLNYFGQGAYVLAASGKVSHPFYEIAPTALRVPLIVLATMATVIASQAMISGAFSLSHQAVQLGFLPRLRIIHTSGMKEGQIYVPAANLFLALGCMSLVIAFQSSSKLAAAYGIAVTGAMTITSILFYAVVRERWGRLRAGLLVALFLTFDLAFLASNVIKIPHGGWIPLVIGTVVFLVTTTWKRGRASLAQQIHEATLPFKDFIESIRLDKPTRVPGTAVFMTLDTSATPLALLHYFKHSKVLHERVILLSMITERVPEVRREQRVQFEDVGEGFYRVLAHYGFMQTPRVPDVFERLEEAGLQTRIMETSFYLGRESLLVNGRSGMNVWRAGLFAFLSRNASAPSAYFGIPPNRVMEIGALIEV